MGASFEKYRVGDAVVQQCVAALASDVPVLVVTGHYGVGKTNFSLNLALDAVGAGREVTLVDLDVVNPYFRSSEYREDMEAAGIRLIAPVFAERGSNLDVPSLTGAIVPAINMAQHAWGSGKPLVIIDAGGDDAGATALARFAPTIKKAPYRLVHVVNRYRTLTQEAGEAVQVMREVEEASNLTVSAIVGNSHMMGDTDVETVLAGIEFAHTVAQLANLPLVCATYPEACVQRENLIAALENDSCELYPVRIYVRTPWDTRS